MSSRIPALILLLALACDGGDGDDGEAGTTVGDTTGGATEPTTGGGSDDGPTGAACPLEGLYIACEREGAEGVTYCDKFGGELRFGPCVVDPVCRLTDPPSCDGYCAVIDGVPKLIVPPDGCGGEGI